MPAASASSQSYSAPPIGFQVLQANHLEDLRRSVVWVAQRYPLSPLEQDTFLVQSNGIAQWLKLALAEDPASSAGEGGLGIAAATNFLLPSRFIWQIYRAVLTADGLSVPEQSPFDKEPLRWRLYRLLPELLNEPEMAPLVRFQAGAQPARRIDQLAQQIADLFDQYQVFRADWLSAWESGGNELPGADGSVRPLAAEHLWQPSLWRRLVADMREEDRSTSRSAIHTRFMEAGNRLAPDQRPAGLPRRVMVFGVSSMPRQILEALSILGRFSQVVLCVHNPCRYYWGDIISHRGLFGGRRGRSPSRPGRPDDPDPEKMHLHAQPLLAAWGQQGRDYIRLIDQFDQPQQYQQHFRAGLQTVDIFESPGSDTLLHQLQDDILELRPLHESRAHWPPVDPASDDSIVFHTAHSRQREVEILHDQLLAAFAADPGLRPRDVMVMVPDINAYAPHIQAVFGYHDRESGLAIPFTVSDQGRRHRLPVLVALEALLSLPESRFAASELLSLLEVPAIQTRFDLSDQDIPLIRRWVEGANIRWGLHANQRQSLGLPAGMGRNSWLFGIRRMLLGYASGDSVYGFGNEGGGDAGAWGGIEPYAEVGGLEARIAGQLALFVDALETAWELLQQEATPEQWQAHLLTLESMFFAELDASDQLLFDRLKTRFRQWRDHCTAARLESPLPLTVVREALLEGLDEQGLNQRFLAGKVNFATLLPMRAIPFRRVCLLGMNDGDYPRSRTPMDFDLMAQDYRPGDRSRREDDRYLFLEALLSARDQLYISWIGRSVRDDTPKPPSVLVAQLRDHLDSGWRQVSADQAEAASVSAALTLEHPLQPFSPEYFPQGSEHRRPTPGERFSFEQEWRREPLTAAAPLQPLAAPELPDEPLTLVQLERFLRDPPRAFYEQRLQVHLREGDDIVPDHEPFNLNGLERWALQNTLMQQVVLKAQDASELPQRVEQALNRLSGEGELGLATTEGRLRQELSQSLPDVFQRYQACLEEWPDVLDTSFRVRLEAATEAGNLALDDLLPSRRTNPAGEQAQIVITRGDLLKGSQRKSYHYRNMLEGWLQHLAAQIAYPVGQYSLGHCEGSRVTTVLIGRTTSVRWAPMEAAIARERLTAVLQSWFVGMCQPLPVTISLASAWFEGLGRKHDEDRAWQQFEQAVEAAYARDPGYLQRGWPQPQQLIETAGGDNGFAVWRDQLYAPLILEEKQ